MKLDRLKDLYIEQLRDLYSAETQIISALPEMINKTSHRELRTALQNHLEETREQKKRLQQVFSNLNVGPEGEMCEAMKGLIREAKELLKKDADADVLDAGIIASAQRVEHYEIAGYGTVCTYAEMLDREDDYKLLSATLGEEKESDKKLTRIAKQVVNPEAQAA